MPRRRAIHLPGGPTVHLAFTTTADGDLRVDADPDVLRARRQAVAPGAWTWLRQVHGAAVAVVGEPGEHAGAEADAAVTAVAGAVLAVHTADCAPVLMWASGPDVTVLGAAHAGWRGLESGVLDATVAAMRSIGAGPVSWCAGPCISAERYEFGEDVLERVARRVGHEVRGRTSEGAPALDLLAGVRARMAALGATEDGDGPDECTATSGVHHSWRARRDEGRQAAAIWIEP